MSAFLPHIAFELHTIVANIPYRIADVAVLDDRVFLATSDGLLVYGVEAVNAALSSSSSSSSSVPSAPLSGSLDDLSGFVSVPASTGGAYRTTLVFSDKKFAKKPVSKLAVLEREQVLLSLSDSIYVHDVRQSSSVRALGSIAKAKGASLFAVDASKTVPLLVVALKKKLLVLSMKSSTDFVELRELALPDVPRMLHFCADNVCIGFRKEYCMVRLANGATTEVCQTGRATTPLATPLPEQQMLLVRDNIGVFTYYDGRSTGRTAVPFTEPPLAIAYRFPFVIAALQRAVEVRGVGGAQGLAQQLPARDVQWLVIGTPSPPPVALPLAGGDGESTAALPSAAAMAAEAERDTMPLYAASAGALWRLRPVPLHEQCDRLVRERRFDEALALCETMPVDTRDRADRLRRIKRLFALHLFATGQFERALSFLLELRTFPLDVLALYDGLLPEAAAALGAARLAAQALESGVTAPGPLGSGQRVAAYKALIVYLHRVRGDPVMLSVNEVDAVAPAPASAASAASDVPYAKTSDTARIIDTSLLKACLVGDAAQLNALLEGPNQCDLAECERALMDAERHADLVQLYFSKGLHRQALELLLKLAHGRGPLSGFSALVAYLLRLGAADTQLVLQYSRAALQAAPQAALAIFCTDRAERERLPRDVVLAHLRQYAPQLVQEYLEFVLQRSQWVETRPQFHNELIGEYLTTIVALKRNQLKPAAAGGAAAAAAAAAPVPLRVKAGSEPGLLGATRKKLLAFLESSEYYHAEALLSKFPLDDLFEERALLLAKLGQHESALSIYVYTLGDLATAEAYCARRYASGGANARDVYLALVRVCVAPPAGVVADRDAALALVNRYAAYLDPAATLALLDDGVRIADLSKFFTDALRHCAAERRQTAVLAGLQRSAHRHAKQQLLQERARSRRITRNDSCAVCGKRMGAAAFALLENNDVIHYYCRNLALPQKK
jgi:tetratricopeptide (TPR) repeat protein